MSTLDPADEPATLVGLLDGLLDQGVHVAGDLSIGLADVDLIRVALRVLVASEETAQRTGRGGRGAPIGGAGSGGGSGVDPVGLPRARAGLGAGAGADGHDDAAPGSGARGAPPASEGDGSLGERSTRGGAPASEGVDDAGDARPGAGVRDASSASQGGGLLGDRSYRASAAGSEGEETVLRAAEPGSRRSTAGRSPAGRTRSEVAEADREQLTRGIAQLVLTVVEVVRELLERQAVRRVEAGSLDDEQIERLGVALEALEERMADVKDVFGVTDEDLNLDLGPLGRLR